MEIEYFPFSAEFKEVMLNGKKTKTSRNKKYGEAGDTFKAFKKKFTLVEVKKEMLEDIAENYFREEGFETPEEFIKKWKELHTRKGWIPDQLVYVHEFK
jgi:hypothetical protein